VNETPAQLLAQSLFDDESRQQIDADDWDDQDLLTKDEARERLQRAADLLNVQLASAGSDAETEDLRAQLDRINGVLRTLGG